MSDEYSSFSDWWHDYDEDARLEKHGIAAHAAWKAACAWQAARATPADHISQARDAVIEECAKEADDSAAQYSREARGGDNSGASDHKETAAREIAADIRALNIYPGRGLK